MDASFLPPILHWGWTAEVLWAEVTQLAMISAWEMSFVLAIVLALILCVLLSILLDLTFSPWGKRNVRPLDPWLVLGWFVVDWKRAGSLLRLEHFECGVVKQRFLPSEGFCSSQYCATLLF